MSESYVALVTGAAQGLGASICEVLLENDYKVSNLKLFILFNNLYICILEFNF